MNTDIETSIVKITDYARKNVKPDRFAHSVRVAQTSESLCRRFGIEPFRKGYLAGIAHDICKEASDIVMISYALRDGFPVFAIERTKLSLLHGRAAAMMIQIDFGITDTDIIEAVHMHTFGKPGMCDLAKVLFIADKIEPGREHSSESYMRQFDDMTLNQMVRYVVSENIQYLESRGKKVSSSSLDLLQSLVSDNIVSYETLQRR